MKIWLKMLLGITAGVLLGVFLPDEFSNNEILESVSGITINLGRYVLIPLVLFSVASGLNKLIQKKKSLAVFRRTFLYAIGASALLSVIGTLSVLLLSPERIPIFVQENAASGLPGFQETMTLLFPRNLFMVFVQEGNHILPVFILALVIGFNLNFDKIITRPAVQLLDSLSGIFFHINSFIIELLGFFMIPLSWFMTEQLMAAPELALFRQLLLAILADFVIVIFIIYPLIIYILVDRKNPYKWIYASLAPALAAMVSGDGLFSLGIQFKNSRENMGAARESGETGLTLLSVFGKAGTAMLTGISFIVILKSYSSLGLNLQGVLWVMLFSFLCSFITGPFPGTGVFVAVSLLCSIYGKGLEEGYLILQPVLPLLVSAAVTLDAVTNMLISLIVSKRAGMQEALPASKFS